jgi:hypothetical protein
MKDLGFTVYDFFGYIASGILFIFAYQIWIFKQVLIPVSFSFESGLLYIISAYIIGHLLSFCSKIIFERPLNKKSSPVNILLNECRHHNAVSDYYSPLPVKLRNIINSKLPLGLKTIPCSDSKKREGESLLLYLDATLGKDDKIKPRIDVYLSLYGFCRAVSFTLFLITGLIILGSFSRGTYMDLAWAGIAMACAGGMFLRYLKFYRLYAEELLIAFTVNGDH